MIIELIDKATAEGRLRTAQALAALLQARAEEATRKLEQVKSDLAAGAITEEQGWALLKGIGDWAVEHCT
jgi:hypothetical protein